MDTKVIALASVLSLTGCVTVDPSSVSNVVTQIRNTAVDICGYHPAIDMVADIVGGLVGQGILVGQVEQVAQEICAAAAQIKSSRLRGAKHATVWVRGVPLQGRFIR